jgi:hypothetical protein
MWRCACVWQAGRQTDRHVQLHTNNTTYSRTPFTRTLVIRIANYWDRLAPSGKFVGNFTKPTCLEITGYQIKYSTVQCCGFWNFKSGVVERFRRK